MVNSKIIMGQKIGSGSKNRVWVQKSGLNPNWVWVRIGSVFSHPSASTLEDVIARYVLAGSIVHTDLWKGYSMLSPNMGFNHHTVNHSAGFKNHETGVHTNTVEGTNNGLKILIWPRNRTADVDDHLDEFVWRHKNCNNLWSAFIAALKEVHYDFD
jgi:hypothetical protein